MKRKILAMLTTLTTLLSLSNAYSASADDKLAKDGFKSEETEIFEYNLHHSEHYKTYHAGKLYQKSKFSTIISYTAQFVYLLLAFLILLKFRKMVDGNQSSSKSG